MKIGLNHYVLLPICDVKNVYGCDCWKAHEQAPSMEDQLHINKVDVYVASSPLKHLVSLTVPYFPFDLTSTAVVSMFWII